MRTIPASQLLCTDVEADRSPKGRRGFQIWLATSTLTEVQQLEIWRRLSDFQLPESNAADPIPARHLYFRLTDGHFVIAQTVPLKDKDRFGRGGRFFAHALIVGENDIAGIGFDPFRILDGSAKFFTSPDEVEKAGIDWRPGMMPKVTIDVSDSPELEKPEPTTLSIFAELVGWLPLTEERTIAVPERPDIVLGVIRDVFRFLPPNLRKLCSFDTLSTGEHLNKLPYRIAGAFSPAQFRMWSFRRSHRLDLAPQPKFHPPLDKVAETLSTSLAVRWLANPISDEQKGAALRLVSALEGTQLSDCDPSSLTDEILADLVSIPQIRAFAKRAIEARLREDLGTVLAGMSGVREWGKRYFPFGSRESFERLSKPIPTKLLGSRLLEVFESKFPPSIEELNALREWIRIQQAAAPLRLKMIVARWFPSMIPKLIDKLREPESQAAEWLREWCLKTLSPTWKTREGLNSIARNIAAKGIDDRLGAELNLFLELHAQIDTPDVSWLRFWQAVAEGKTELMRHLIEADPSILERLYNDWLPDLTLSPRWACHHLAGNPELFFGCDLLPEAETGSRILPILSILADGKQKRRFFDYWLPFATPRPEHYLAGYRPEESPQVPAAVEKLNRYIGEKQWDKIPSFLQQANDELFAALVNLVLRPKLTLNIETLFVSNDCFWVGLKLMLIESGSQWHYYLMEGFMRALLPIHDLLAKNDPGQPFSDVEHRLRWLMMRLLQPINAESPVLTRDEF